MLARMEQKKNKNEYDKHNSIIKEFVQEQERRNNPPIRAVPRF